jgi:hypothetical protein
MSAMSSRPLASRRVARLVFPRVLPLIALLALVLGTPTTRRAQAQGTTPVAVSDTVVEVRLSDGSVLFGRVIAAEGTRITIASESGARIELDRAQIALIKPTASRLVNGQRWNEDPNATRLFFGPTGRAIGRGEGYFAVYELLMPFLSFGVSDRVSLSGGTPIVPLAMGEVFYLAPKVTVVSQPGVDLATGVLAFFAPDEAETVGLLYGVGTFGSRDNAFTVGLGLPFITGEGDTFSDRLVLMFGGEARVSQRTKFITESYFMPGESGGIVTGGFRFFGERLSADAGLGMFVGDGDAACCLPIVNFVYAFGKPK